MALVVLCLIAVAVAAPAAAQQLDATRRRAQTLIADIRRSEARLTAHKAALDELSRRIGAAAAQVDETRSAISETEQRMRTTLAQLDDLRTGIGVRARTLYKRGPASVLDLILGTRTLRGFINRLGLTAAIVRRDSTLVERAESLQARLNAEHEERSRLQDHARDQVDALASRRAQIQQTVTAEIATAGRLARERREAAQLATELEARLAAVRTAPSPTPLQASPPPAAPASVPKPAAAPKPETATEKQLKEDVVALKYVAGQGMTIGYGQWAAEFLGALGAPASRNNLVAVVAWEVAEGTLATWNPLATTYPMPGATIYNGARVRNYTSKSQGIKASLLTLGGKGHRYEAIVSNLKASADPMQTARAINASNWCRGCAGGNYVTGLIPAVEKSYSRYAD